MKATSSARRVLSSVQSTLPMLKTIMANKVFQYAIVVDLASSSTMLIHISTIFFYFKYIQHIENASRAQVTYVSMLGVSAMVSMPFLTYMSAKQYAAVCDVRDLIHGCSCVFFGARFFKDCFSDANSLGTFRGKSDADSA